MVSTKGKPNRDNRRGLDRVSPDIKVSFPPDQAQHSMPDSRPIIPSATRRIDQAHPMFPDLMKFWLKAGKPAEFMYAGDQWMSLTDNGQVFVLKGVVPTSDAMYGDLSMGSGT
jgi:hypothetical protein